MNDERWLDPDPDEVVGYCSVCGGEIYKGERVYEIDGERFHFECRWEWFGNKYQLKEAQ